jgi:hypothetical protein
MIVKNLLMDRKRMARVLVISSIATVVLFPLCMLLLAHSLLYVPTCHDGFSIFSSIPECQRVTSQLYVLWALFVGSALLALASLVRWLYLKLRRGVKGPQKLQPSH